ncbi:AAA family ATPase [Clostridiaceae bacterium 35-E11]
MNKITARLLGTPEVFYNGHRIKFPFRKAEALFYYLLVEKQASRDILVNFFWPELQENTAKKNLRNAVYMIRKVFEADVIVSPQRAMLMLSEDISWKIDVDQFLQNQESTGIALYQGEFLQGLLVKDAENFEHWMFRERDAYRDSYMHKLHKLLKKYISSKRFMEAEDCCKKLIAVDEFNEEPYRILMEVYSLQGQYNKGIETYNKLVEVLDKELAIRPDLKTNDVFETLLKEKSIQESLEKEESQCFYYGRKEEIKFLKQNHYAFHKQVDRKSIVVLGEAGIGKSRLVEEFFKSSNLEEVYVFKAYCYEAEENYLLRPWNGIFSKLSKLLKEENVQIPPLWKNIVRCIFPAFFPEDGSMDKNLVENVATFKYQVAENAIVNILLKVAEEKKIILFFEDLQWIDQLSLSLLQTILLENRNTSLMMIATCRSSHQRKIDQFFGQISRYDLMKKIELKRLSKEDTLIFASRLLPDYAFTEELKNVMYNETEGNTFFLLEFLNNLKENGTIGMISPKMEDILKNRIANVSSEGQKILSIASVFFDKVTFASLQGLSGKKELELLDIIDELQQKGLIKEVVEEKGIAFVFTHQKLREYVYQEMSLSRKMILHHQIAKCLEKQIKNKKTDVLLYSKLIYHFSNANDRLGALKYQIKSLGEYLQFRHELFPVVGNATLKKEKILRMSEQEALKRLNKIKDEIEVIREEEGEKEELRMLELLFLYMLGRCHIRQGEYDYGIMHMQKAIEGANAINDFSLALKSYIQMIYYCMNTQNAKDMKCYLKNAFEVANKMKDKETIGILLRLQGYARIMEGNYQEGETILKEALDVFKVFNHEDKYASNIAAVYHFMGESKRHNCKFEEAIACYHKAIHLCEEKKIWGGLGIIYTNAGQAAFAMENYDEAQHYFDKALGIYAQLDYLWGRSIAKGYKAILSIKEKNYSRAFAYLEEAKADAKKLKSPYEIGLIYSIKARIRTEMLKDDQANTYFRQYLPEDVKVYCNEAIHFLQDLKGCYEIQVLETLKNIQE